MLIADTHVHVFTDDRERYPQIRDTARAGTIPTITEIGQTEWPLTTAERLIAQMDEAGVHVATLVQAYFVYEYDNRYAIDAAAAHPDRFTGVVVLDPMDPGSPDELSRMVESKHVSGIRFMRGRLPESALGKPQTFPLWARIQELRIPLAINDFISDYPRIRAPMERYPDVKVAFEHSWGHKVGAPPAHDVLQPLFDLAGNPNVYIKTAINNIAAARDGGGTPRELYSKLVDVFGAKRIMWSSNYPAHPRFGDIKPRLEESKKALAHLSADEQAWIFGKTALAFYPALQRMSSR
jgi:predicted TIM-barrel fold metal-dependent hydrolase